MKQAICMGYAESQNEPSRPINKIFNLPNVRMQRDKLLKEIFIEHVCDVGANELKVRLGAKDDFGDIIVEAECGLYMFVTYIE